VFGKIPTFRGGPYISIVMSDAWNHKRNWTTKISLTLFVVQANSRICGDRVFGVSQPSAYAVGPGCQTFIYGIFPLGGRVTSNFDGPLEVCDFNNIFTFQNVDSIDLDNISPFRDANLKGRGVVLTTGVEGLTSR
jgi:hypothetical protein